MDMGFDHAAWPHTSGEPAGDSAGFDWHELRARFLAAHAVRGEFGPDRAAPMAGGSFHAATAAALADLEAETLGINRNDLGDRKDERATAGAMHGDQAPAIEGDDD
jgi:hypothetical protein